MVKTYGLETSLDLLALSDAFRRHAAFPNPDIARQLVEEARKVAVLSTYYYTEHADLPENKKVDMQLRGHVREIANLASQIGADHVVLPLTGDRRSWVARRVNNDVLKNLDLPLKVTQQKSVYSLDLSAIGPIDKEIKTALDKGVRGVMSIKSNIMNSWDR